MKNKTAKFVSVIVDDTCVCFFSSISLFASQKFCARWDIISLFIRYNIIAQNFVYLMFIGYEHSYVDFKTHFQDGIPHKHSYFTHTSTQFAYLQTLTTASVQEQNSLNTQT